MNGVNVQLRPARDADMDYVNAYAAWEGMDAIPSPEGVTVAVNEDDVPIGFVRVWVDPQNGQAYVNPIVVACGSLYSVADITQAYHDLA